MKYLKTYFIFLILFFFNCSKESQPNNNETNLTNISTIQTNDQKNPNRTIFAYGGNVYKPFIKYVAELTGKTKPKICFIPTGLRDMEKYIIYWYEECSGLDIEPKVLRVWITSHYQKESFDEIISSMDAIIVSGGNTLNMLAIWKAQGIDIALRSAYEKGIIMAGGSAGSLCWFNGGTTDSRPKELSLIDGMSFIDYSHCPHYSSEESRRPLYHNNILDGNLSDGYACDDSSGVVFINEQYSHSVSLDEKNKSYFVFERKGEIIEEILHSEMIH